MNVDIPITQALNGYVVTKPHIRKLTLLCAVWLAPALVAATVFLLLQYGREDMLRIGFLSLLVALIARFGIVELVYATYPRSRPEKSEGISPLFINTNPSFPSGHATFFSALVTSLALFHIPGVAVLALIVVIMCIGRVAAGVHYPSDILAGFIVGVGTAWIAFSATGLYL